jgi:putative spermidine/putrescine transport system substrate-binding protein
LVAGAALSALVLVPAAASAETLVVAIFGGSFADNTRECAAKPLEAQTGASVQFVLGSSVQTVAKLRAAKDRSGIDVSYMDIQIVKQAKNEGLIQKIDYENLVHVGDLYDSAKDSEDQMWVSFMYSGTAIAYNPNELPKAPDSWQDMWDPKYRGRIAVPDISGTAGQQFLIAAARLEGGSLTNVDPGFEAIKKLKPHVVTYYTQADQIVALLERGDIILSPWYIDRVGAAAAKGVPVALAFPKEGAIGIIPTVSIPLGSPNKALAEKYIEILLSPEGQKCFAERQYAGPTNKTVELPPEIGKFVPYKESVERMYFPDTAYIARKLPEWTDRWNREIAR